MRMKKDLMLMRQKAAEMIGQKREFVLSRKAVSVDMEKHTAIFVMSTAQIDRYGDIVDQESWILDYFNQNPYFALQHRSNDFPIGKWLRVWFEADPGNPGKKLMLGEAFFNTKYPDAERAFDHVAEGEMNMVSVGFIPHRVEYDENTDAFILYDNELLECSLVGIGANRQALVRETDPEDALEEARKTAIAARDALDTAIKADENMRVIHHLDARELLSQAIRRIEKPAKV